jgi:hypothetical protein
MKKVVTLWVFLLFSAALWGQSNELLDDFLNRETADVATSVLLVGQALGVLSPANTPAEGYDWAVEQKPWGRRVKRRNPDDPMTLGVYYLVLMQAFGVEGGGNYRAYHTPRYAAMEAGFRGWVDPGRVYTDRRLTPTEVITALSTVMEVAADDE